MQDLQQIQANAQLILAGQMQYQRYEDATYCYHCLALPGTPLAGRQLEAEGQPPRFQGWQVAREVKDNSAIRFAGGSAAMKWPAPDLETVAAYVYDLEDDPEDGSGS